MALRQMLGTLLLMLSACVVDSSHVAVMSSGSLLCAVCATASRSRGFASLNLNPLALTLTSTLILTLTRRFNLQPTVDRIVRPMSAPPANPSTSSLAPPHSQHRPPRSAGCRRGIRLSTSSHSSPGAARRGDPVSLLTTSPPTRASAQGSASERRCSSTCKPQEERWPI